MSTEPKTIRPSLPRRRAAAAIAALPFAAGPARAQAFPDRPLKLIVPFPAGGAADAAARAFGDRFAALLGQPVVVDYRPGASGNIGAEVVARGAADGHTLLFGNEFLATNPVVFNSVRYDTLRDFAPVARVASTPAAIAAHPSLPAKTFAELVALAKTRPLNYASPGVGTGPHLYGQLIALSTGARFDNVPYKGSAPATADAVGGQVDFIVSTLAPMLPHLAAGRLRGLAVTGARRAAQAPDIPTLGELDASLPRYDVWYGVFAPSAVPAPVLARLRQAAAQVMQDADLTARLRATGFDVEPSTPEAFGAEIRADLERWARVVRDAKIPKE
ncbi:MAG: hypothetical protein RJA99_290 [Pseudomonadota bacterium]